MKWNDILATLVVGIIVSLVPLALITLAGCGGNAQPVVEYIAQKAECESRGGYWACQTAATCECKSQEVTPTIEPTPKPTTEPVSWKPFTVREVDPSLGTVTFTVRGINPAKLNGRDWNIANVEGIAADGNLLQCHPSVWQGAGLMDAPCQWFNKTPTPTETHKQHNATWRADAEYRWQLDWSLESFTIQVWENGNRVILIETKPPASFSKINHVVIGDGVFAGYPGIGVEVKE